VTVVQSVSTWKLPYHLETFWMIDHHRWAAKPQRMMAILLQPPHGIDSEKQMTK
jgi:hypothetical protein